MNSHETGPGAAAGTPLGPVISTHRAPSGPESPAFERLAQRLVRIAVALLFVGAGSILAGIAWYEVQTSALQARLLSGYAAKLTYQLRPGASSELVFPAPAPLDRRRGYSRLPQFSARLESRGFQISQQVRMSPQLTHLARWGITPPYPEPASAGLSIRGRSGMVVYDQAHRDWMFAEFDEIPPLVSEALAFMENREILNPPDPRSNPAIEWSRMAKAALVYAAGRLGLPFPPEGGSTLATQLEKYRHSPGGRTTSPADKLRQIAAASFKVYRDGPETRDARRRIMVDYLNTMPLAAFPGYGEVHGLGEGLYVWYGLRPSEIAGALRAGDVSPSKAHAFKHALALLAAVRAPSAYLLHSRGMLEKRVDAYTRLLAQEGILDPDLAEAVLHTPLSFAERPPVVPPPSFRDRKAVTAIRAELLSLLGVESFYELDRLHLAVDASIDHALQAAVIETFDRLADPEFVKQHDLRQKYLLRGSDPSQVLYSFLLFERTPDGNLVRVQADNLDQPFDINGGMKMELGSTAKLRSLAHYLELVALLHGEMAGLDERARAQRTAPVDPITQWAAQTLRREPGLDLTAFLERALDRRYSASPGEAFFTGGGRHSFGNFDRDDNHRIMSLREALQKSTNLVFIRLMRDLVHFHRARLPYDADAVLNDTADPTRQEMLKTVGENEADVALRRAYERYRGREAAAIVAQLLGKKADSLRHLAILYFAWGREGASCSVELAPLCGPRSEDGLAAWLRQLGHTVSEPEVRRLMKAYQNPRLNISDYGYLLSKHPLDVWCAGELVHDRDLSSDELRERSREAREISSRWLFKTRNRRAQDLRLRIQTERDAFARMTPYWRRLGFPFERLVPTYATAIGNSGDRPVALAELMGIILNDGLRRPMLRLTRLHFAAQTPYETVFEPHSAERRVMEPEVARALRSALAGVVEQGTARRIHRAFVGPDGAPVTVGGKTGSGDNRFQSFNRWGGVTSSRAVNRTATFVFYIGERYFGVLTAHVPGRQAAQYEFTSALPVSVLKLLGPEINARLRDSATAPVQSAIRSNAS